MLQTSRNRLGEYNKSCSSSHQESRKIEFAFFWFSYGFLEILQVSAIPLLLLKFPICTEDPTRIETSQLRLVYRKHPRKTWPLAIPPLAVGAARLAGIRRDRRRSRPGEGSGSTTCSPRIGWWPQLGWRGRRRGRTVRTGGGGRSVRCCRRGRLPACLQAKATAHVRARGGVGCVGQRRNAQEEWEVAQAAVMAAAVALVVRARVERGLK
jgi:hypothetical protein